MKANTAQQKVISDASDKLNTSKGRTKAPPDDVLVRRIRRLNEETRSFAYTNPYYAGPQVGIFIGDRWVSNAITIEYTESSTDSPIYGYSSRWFDAVMQGNVVVQGNLTIAFTDGAYLGQFLANYHTGEGQSDAGTPGPVDPITRAKQFWWGLGQTEEASLNTEVPMNFRQSSDITGFIGKGFDIRVFFGAREFLEKEQTTSPSGPIEVIKDVHVTSRAMVVSPSGDPIGESWSFFARAVQTQDNRSQSPAISTIRTLSLNQDIKAPSVLPQGGTTGLGNTVRLGFPN
jgi:hypothetical protein